MNSEGIPYKPRDGEVGMCPRVGRMGPNKYGILGEAMETSASFEARSAPLPYPTLRISSSPPAPPSWHTSFPDCAVIRERRWQSQLSTGHHCDSRSFAHSRVVH